MVHTSMFLMSHTVGHKCKLLGLIFTCVSLYLLHAQCKVEIPLEHWAYTCHSWYVPTSSFGTDNNYCTTLSQHLSHVRFIPYVPLIGLKSQYYCRNTMHNGSTHAVVDIWTDNCYYYCVYNCEWFKLKWSVMLVPYC